MRHYRNLASIFSTVALIATVSIVSIFLAGRELARSRQNIQAHLAAIQRLDDFLLTLTTAETSQRGYILTGQESYLKPYANAAPAVNQELDDLQGNDLFPKGTVQSLRETSSEKLAELAKTIQLRRTKGAAAADAVVQTNVGQDLMDKIRDSIYSARRSEQEAIATASIHEDSLALLHTLIYALAGIVNLSFLGWAYLRISRDKTLQDQAFIDLACEREEVLRQREFLNVTLGSIGDCVIVSDTEGQITFMNDVAATVTGWKKEEALSMPVASVFHIINEDTRAIVENPVDKVIKSGKIVGLANHTLLIRKDGSEIPIDDSGAPIRESSGALRGVVLVFRDFSEYKKAERELINAKSVAEAASKAKDHFLAMLSHELRTPLTPVLATLNRWEMTNELPPPVRADVEMVRRSVELEARIIDDLLDLTRISKGMLSLTPEPTNVHGLLEPLAGMYRSEIHAKDLHLSMQLNAARPYVYLDGSRLQQVVWNIFRNAAKFTDRGGRITVETSNDVADNIVIRVTDTGVGMDEGTLSRLFIPFEQGEKDLSRRYGGLGLGLAISRSLVDLLGGKITAKSDGLGKGSMFEVTFPSIETVSTAGAAESPTDDPSVFRRNLNILLVEDHADTGLAMSRLLEARGHQVRVASTVSSAMSIVDNAGFDLILCDLGLPDGTGIEVVTHLRKTRATPAIALSGFGMEEDLARCLEAGFNLHITKPVNVKQLEAGIVKLLSGNG